jgi:hypothetical protein
MRGSYASIPYDGEVGLHFEGLTVEVVVMFTLMIDAFRSNFNRDYDQNNHISLHIPS